MPVVSIEDIGEDDLKVFQKLHEHLALLTRKDLSVKELHLINMENEHHQRKSSSLKNNLK
ncbi:hypothetical protein [Flavobacterium urumqiense]|uniref:hypothetical protein n=1 Tax=Flavobacterium urumqiense TaxID=935224 RepID=UPI000CDE9C38|nr:hypothetical protein [Flavobacterium urumqiense]